MVWDIAKFVRERDIFFAVRGSAAASLALFCLGVTDVNPLEFDLVFERFLNMERKEMPDIDMDFQDDRREEVINYVVDKYGREHVAQIITFGTLGARASIRDVGRALAMSYADVDRVARLVPFRPNITLADVKQESAEFSELYEADEGIRKLIDTSMKLEGLTRHSSTHAAGVVISGEPLDDVVPLQRPTRGDGEGVLMTQFSMDPIAELGLLKMDFLGLANLTVLAKTREMILRTRGQDIPLQEIPLDDANAFDLLARGDTVGVFQLEGAGMTRYIKELKPSSLGDVAAMIALYRPGPMEHITAFIDAKHGRAKARYLHPALEDILEETYGIIVYQDQVLQIFRTFAGYSLGAADIVRKAMGKKDAEIMAEEEQQFVQGCVQNGHTRELASTLFELITPFAGYAFNKAHSVSYGLISYWTAYFKANYPVEYMASLLNANGGNTDRIAIAVNECRRLGIGVLPPDIRASAEAFTIETQDDGSPAIRYGLASVKNVGGAALAPVVSGREKDGPFESIEQMCRVADFSGVNRKSLESLIRAGAFDAYGERNGLLSIAERIVSLAQSEARLRNSNQSSMFDMFGESVPTPLFELEVPDTPTSDNTKWQWEKELLGVPVSNNLLLASLAGSDDPGIYAFVSQIEGAPRGETVRVRGPGLIRAAPHHARKQAVRHSIARAHGRPRRSLRLARGLGVHPRALDWRQPADRDGYRARARRRDKRQLPHGGKVPDKRRCGRGRARATSGVRDCIRATAAVHANRARAGPSATRAGVPTRARAGVPIRARRCRSCARAAIPRLSRPPLPSPSLRPGPRLSRPRRNPRPLLRQRPRRRSRTAPCVWWCVCARPARPRTTATGCKM